MIQADVLSPLARSVLDALSDAALVFDAGGKLLYANQAARATLEGSALTNGASSVTQLLPHLAPLSPKIKPVWIGDSKVADLVVLSPGTGTDTLAERERRAILDTLDSTGWRFAAAARQLGISRTTLWRRLRRYGFTADGRSRWLQPS
ncbi:MAG: helix-turn-helix domain-containing protein [Gemmatimonadetes bacterium]|nr:helix-turn-helix domain-containing protein [Gemmatimonadota bacterium]